MDISVFVILLSMTVLLTFLGLIKHTFDYFGFFSSLILAVAMLADGVTETVGYQGGSVITNEIGLSYLLLIPIIFGGINFLSMVKGRELGRL